MQATRERILKILKERGQATVKELSEVLDLTTVTIRHHLDTLRREDLVAAPDVRHRKAPGRPQHVYTLTEEASDFFPKRYERLIDLMFDEIHSHFSHEEVEEMMVRIGKRIASSITIPQSADLEERVVVAANFMDELGYMADWKKAADGNYLIHVANCPYEGVARQHSEVCKIDQTMLRELLGVSFEEIRLAPSPPRHCIYVIETA
jgi:predicted ArsR family transcriptional regulator